MQEFEAKFRFLESKTISMEQLISAIEAEQLTVDYETRPELIRLYRQ
jgi:hypothetical protein